MAASIESFRKTTPRRYSLDGVDHDVVEDTEVQTHPLDTPEAQQKLARLREWWDETRTAHSENRFQQAIDADFYDGFQWKEEDILLLEERGQAPLVFNVIRQHINWILGTERRTRVDFRVHPRKKLHEPIARAKTQLLKFVSDVNKGQYVRSRAFEDSVKVGVGWLEDGIRSDPREEPCFQRYESWRNIWWDHLAREPDLSDARYMFRVKWVDTDVAEAMFPDRRRQVIESARVDDLIFHEDDEDFVFSSVYFGAQPQHPTLASGRSFLDASFTIGNRRSRNKLIEVWYREPANRRFLRARRHALMRDELLTQLDRVDGMPYDPDDINQSVLIQGGLASTYDAVKMQVRCAIFCGSYLLQDMPSPYDHDRFPFTPVWAYRRDRDGMPYGPVRSMRDPQEDLNKRRSKALFILSTNQLIADEDAFEDWDEAADEAARPDGVLKKRRGAEVEIRREIELAEEHVRLMEQDIAFLQSTSGVTEENLGEVTNTNSGYAINLRQTQGSVVTATLFDNLRAAIQHSGETTLALIEQFYAEPKQVRIIDGRGRVDFLGINVAKRNQQGQLYVENPITETKADFVVDTQDFRETVRLAMADQLMEMASRLDPSVVVQILDLIIELYDLPNGAEIVRRIRKLNGQTDPDDPNRESLEAEADRQRREQADQARRAMEAKTDKDRAQARKAFADADKTTSETMQQALEIVAALSGNTNLARAVDVLMDHVAANTRGGITLATDPAQVGGPPEETLEIETPFTKQQEKQEAKANGKQPRSSSGN